MAALTMYINGQEVEAEEGSTVLAAARAAGFPIPTLCEHVALSNWGGCRMCLVEVEPRGQLHPSCTFPVSPGLRVQTHSPKVVEARRYVLELLFSERSHYCMFCAADGDCELQSLAYEHDMDHWLYGRPDDCMTVDASRQFFIMDHNRCILCRRCIRACGEIAAVHTLDIGARGTKSVVAADLNVPFGDSSCISCGTCLQVCPTGALVERSSAYMGQDAVLDEAKTVCAQCSVGCGITARTRSDRLIRIESDWEAPVNGGLLCRLGRFDPLYVTTPRVTSPLRRLGGELQPCTWDEALELIARGLGAEAGETVTTLVSSRATNEEMDAALAAFSQGSARVALLDGEPVSTAPGQVASISEIENADVVVAIEADLDHEHEVLACFMRRSRDRGGRLFLLGGQAEKLEPVAEVLSSERDLETLAASLGDEARVLVLYGPSARPEALSVFSGVAGTRFLGLPSGVNTSAAAARGLSGLEAAGEGAAFIYAADSLVVPAPNTSPRFLVVQGCYRTEAVEAADVVLPARRWSEKHGHLTNLEGRIQPLSPVVPAPEWARDDREVLLDLLRLGARSRA